jgi:hypothetical protein
MSESVYWNIAESHNLFKFFVSDYSPEDDFYKIEIYNGVNTNEVNS